MLFLIAKAVQQSQFSTELNFYCKTIKKNTKLQSDKVIACMHGRAYILNYFFSPGRIDPLIDNLN